MGGPYAGIPLREPFLEPQIDALERWLRSLTTRLDGERGDWGPFRITAGDVIGVPADVVARGGSFWLRLTDPWEGVQDLEDDLFIDRLMRADADAQQTQLRAQLGFVPQQSLSIEASVNGQSDHRILGHLALALAERYDGWIDLDGAIRPPVRPGDLPRPYGDTEKELGAISAYVNAMPGRVVEISYMTSGDRWVYHVVDTTFMREWLRHPHFHMIK
jgi:hypothetical protein